jgi:hypothetical protein
MKPEETNRLFSGLGELHSGALASGLNDAPWGASDNRR